MVARSLSTGIQSRGHEGGVIGGGGGHLKHEYVSSLSAEVNDDGTRLRGELRTPWNILDTCR